MTGYMCRTARERGMSRQDPGLAAFLMGPCCFLISACFAMGQPAGDSGLAGRFQAEAAAGWQRYGAFADRLQGQVTRSQYDLAKGRAKLPNLSYLKIRQSRSLALLWAHHFRQGKDLFSIEGVNSQYAFALEGKSETALRVKRLKFIDASSEEP